MRQLDLFSALQSNTEGIDTEFKSRAVAWSKKWPRLSEQHFPEF